MNAEPRAQAMVGRGAELSSIVAVLESVRSGRGRALLISGEAGMGKTRLAQAAVEAAAGIGFSVLRGSCSSERSRPFEPFLQMMGSDLLGGAEYTSFLQLLAFTEDGDMVVSESRGGRGAPGVSSEMLAAVRDFVRDSFGGRDATLGKLEFGERKVLIEHCGSISFAGVVSGEEHPDMRDALRLAVREAAKSFPPGRIAAEQLAPLVKGRLSALAGRRFAAKRELAGARLDNERLKASEKVRRGLVARSAGKGVVALVEDMHWCDEGSLFALEYLARNVRRERVLVILTARPTEDGAMTASVSRMVEEGSLAVLRLERLSDDGVRSLLDAAFAPNSFPPDFVSRLARHCDGNPLFVIETVRQMVVEGFVAVRGGAFSLVKEEYVIPATVEEIVRRRVDSMDPEAIALAEYASCIGREFALEMVASVPSLPDARLALEKLASSGIVALSGDRAEFSHAYFHAVLYDGIFPSWKASHHRSIGERLEIAFSGRIEDALYDLARHFSASNEHAKAFRYCAAASEKAESSFAAELAVRYCDMALACVAKFPHDGAEDVRLMIRKGANLQFVGQWDGAEGVLRLALSDAMRAGDEALAAWSKTGLGDILRNRGRYAEAMGALMEAYDSFVRLGERRGACEAMNFMGLVNWDLGEHAKTMECYEAAKRLAEEIDERRYLLRATNNIGLVHWAKGEYDRAMGYYQRALLLAEEIGDRQAASVTLGNIGITYYGLGDFPQALECYGRRLRLAEELGDRRGMASVTGNIGNIYYAQGEYEKASESYNQTLSMSEGLGDKRGIGITLSNIGNLHKLKGRYGEADVCYDQAIEIARAAKMKFHLCGYLHYKADLLFKLGRFSDAAPLNEEALSLAGEVKRPEILLEARVLDAKLAGAADPAAARSKLEAMLSSASEPWELAPVMYELYKLSGEERFRAGALEHYRAAHSKKPDAAYKERMLEIEG